MELLWIPAGIAFVTFVYVVRVYNRLVSRRNDCGNARGGIDANLKKRHDLVPNLVRVVKAYAAHEQEVLRRVTEARGRAAEAIGTAKSPAEETLLVRALEALEARTEAYPELQASEEFRYLARTLTEIEEQLSASRRAFNAHVKAMNDLVEQFPTFLVARPTGFARMRYFELDAAVREHPAPWMGASG